MTGIPAFVESTPRRSTHRVALVGDSVARGFFFDPAVTLASLVARSLRTADGVVDVVDLASANQRMSESASLLEQSAAADPTAIVVFAGNNWIFEPIGEADAASMQRAIDAGRYRDAREQHHAIIASYVDDFFERFSRRLARMRVPGLFVLPEFNLLDAADEAVECVPVRTTRSPGEWLAARDAARCAIAAGRFGDAARQAEALVAMDGGAHPTGYRLLGECALAAGDARAAYGHFAAARDAMTWLPALCTPRCPAAIRSAIRAACASRGIPLLDLCDVFRCEQAVPDRRLFLDSCHLTARGLQLAANAIARELAPHLGVNHAPADLDRDRICDAADEALAHFLAAVHNAQVGAPLAVAEHHCRTALKLSAGVASHMTAYVDFQFERCPWWMSQTFHGLMEPAAARRYFAPPARVGRRHVPFLDIVSRCAKESSPQLAQMKRIRSDASMRDGATIDLLPIAPQLASRTLLPSTSFYRAHSRISRFVFYAPAVLCALRAVWRTPVESSDCLVVQVNGGMRHACPISADWTRCDLDLSAASVPPGRVELTLEWPHRQRARVPRIAVTEGHALLGDPYHAFGDVQRLTVVC